MIAETTAEAAIKDLNDAWTSQVDNQIPNDVAAAVEAYQAYFRAASQYGITPTKANKEAVDAAWTKLRDAFVDVYQAKTGSYNPRQTDLDKAMTTAAANNRLRDCIAGLTRQLNPANSYNVADYAAMAAYKCLMYSDDQFNLINSYLQKQLLTIGWVLLTYNELMAMQADYMGETYSGAEYDVLMENYKAAELDLDKTGETLLEEAADLMDRQLTFSPIEPVKLRLIQLMKPEDNLVVNLQNRSYHSTFPMTAVMEEDSLESNVKAYFEESGQYVKNPDNPAVKTTKAADFELVGVTTGAGTASYYILQQIFQLQDLEYKFNFKSGALYSPDVHTPSCDWYNLRDWQFDFDSGNTAADVQAVFGQATALALNGNTARYALGEHSP